MNEIVFACDMSVLTQSERVRHIDKLKEVFQSVQKIKQVKNGYSFLLPNESSTLMALMKLIEKERLCCPFFRFKIDIHPAGGDVWFSVTGPENIEEFIKAGFSDYLNKNLSF